MILGKGMEPKLAGRQFGQGHLSDLIGVGGLQFKAKFVGHALHIVDRVDAALVANDALIKLFWPDSA